MFSLEGDESLQHWTIEDIKMVQQTSRLPAIFNAFLKKKNDWPETYSATVLVS